MKLCGIALYMLIYEHTAHPQFPLLAVGSQLLCEEKEQTGEGSNSVVVNESLIEQCSSLIFSIWGMHLQV